jgi:hypothetical protein
MRLRLSCSAFYGMLLFYCLRGRRWEERAVRRGASAASRWPAALIAFVGGREGGERFILAGLMPYGCGQA